MKPPQWTHFLQTQMEMVVILLLGFLLISVPEFAGLIDTRTVFLFFRDFYILKFLWLPDLNVLLTYLSLYSVLQY